MILYMYDLCTFYMNNVGWGRLVERQTIIEEIFFHIIKHKNLLPHLPLSFYVGIKYDFLCASTFARPRGRC